MPPADSSTHIAQLMFAVDNTADPVSDDLYGYRLLRNYNRELLYLACHDTLTVLKTCHASGSV